MKKKRTINPVAKFAGDFNKAVTHRDRKNDYRRSTKHKGRVPYDQLAFLIELIVHKRLAII